ncbi:acyltransferase family protein, partial [Raoultella terrigena]|uniref:acyltransferase family protein n=1 Tax=Raoultella terrigena TaxID=577 RepID=UPI0015F2C505
LPALLVACSAILVSGLFAGSADRHRDAGDVLATVFFVQNWRLVSQEDAYFEQVGDPSPLRHAWTLGVEEQFYLLVPALVALIFLLFRRSRTGRFVVVAGLALVSAWWTAHLAGSGVDFSRLYYGTDTRAQALFIGAALGVWLAPGANGHIPTVSRPVVVGAGVVGVVSSIGAFFVVGPYSAWMFNLGG